MSAISDAEYAIMAAAAYRDDDTSFPEDVNLPSGWTEVKLEVDGSDTDGLHYKVFTKGNELVISFRGTDKFFFGSSDMDDNIAAAMGWNSDQIYLAFKETVEVLGNSCCSSTVAA